MNAHVSELSEEQFRANRFELVSRLADDLAHEIRNPLNAIVINLEVLRARLRKGAADTAIDRVEVIEVEVRRLHELIDRMLLLLRPERDDAGSLALDSALDEIVPLLEAQAKLARNEVSCEGNATVFVPARRDTLKFALLNLFMAVHERLGEGGGTLAVSCHNTDDDVRIVIRDVHTEVATRVPAGDVDHAVRIASALLAPCGGRVTSDDAAVTVTLPRAASV